MISFLVILGHLIPMMKHGELPRNVNNNSTIDLSNINLIANYFLLTIGFVLTGNVILLELSNLECLFEYEHDYRRNSCTLILGMLWGFLRQGGLSREYPS